MSRTTNGDSSATGAVVISPVAVGTVSPLNVVVSVIAVPDANVKWLTGEPPVILVGNALAM